MTSLTRGDMYGAVIARGRKRAGYDQACDLAKAVTDETGVKLSRDVLYAIEQGRRTPDVTQYAAINMVVFGEAFPKWLEHILFGEHEGRP